MGRLPLLLGSPLPPSPPSASPKPCSIRNPSSTLVKPLVSLAKPITCMGMGLPEQETITETVSVLCTVVLIVWSLRLILCNVMSLLFCRSMLLTSREAAGEADDDDDNMDHNPLATNRNRMSWMDGLSIGRLSRKPRNLLCLWER